MRDRKKYGLRIPERRLFLFFANIFNVWGFIVDWKAIWAVSSSEEKMNEAFAAVGMNLTWPPGPTIFDEPFREYDKMKMNQEQIGLAAGVFVFFALVVDLHHSSVNSLAFSK